MCLYCLVHVQASSKLIEKNIQKTRNVYLNLGGTKIYFLSKRPKFRGRHVSFLNHLESESINKVEISLPQIIYFIDNSILVT